MVGGGPHEVNGTRGRRSLDRPQPLHELPRGALLPRARRRVREHEPSASPRGWIFMSRNDPDAAKYSQRLQRKMEPPSCDRAAVVGLTPLLPCVRDHFAVSL